MSKAIGIDFGSSTCAVAEAAAGGAARIRQNSENQDFTPAVVGWYKGELVAGSRALDRLGQAPQETVLSVRALLGRPYADPVVQAVRARHAFQVLPPAGGGEDEPRVLLGGQARAPVEIAARLLEKLKADAALRLGGPVGYAVITAPAGFTGRQRSALRQAAKLAGLKVQKLLEEPVAAVLGLGVDRIAPERSRRVLVCDLGGAGFEACLLELAGDAVAVLHFESDPGLGGEEFDRKLVSYVVQQIKHTHGVDLAGNARFMAELRNRAEQAKKDLSNQARTEIALLGLLKGRGGQTLDVEVPLAREQFERLIQADLARCLKLAEAVMTRAGLRPEQIDQVVLTGGGSVIPGFRRAMASLFPQPKILAAPEPMKSVAYGAALMSARLGPRWECVIGHPNPPEAGECARCVAPRAVTSSAIGLRLPGDRFEVVIPAGTPYPTAQPVVKGILTPQANLRRIRIQIYQGHSRKASENELQATVWVELPPRLPERTAVDLSLQLDADGILEVKAALRNGSGRPLKVFADRGEPRGRLEEKLHRARRAWEARRAEAQQGFEAAYERAVEALSGGDEATAEGALAVIERLVEALAGALPQVRGARGQ